MKVTLSLAQFNMINGDPAANLATVQKMAAEAAQRGTDILLLPELWATGDAFGYAEYIEPAIAETARQYNLHIIGSNLSPNGEGGRMTNTAVFHNNRGQILARYDKIHIFQLMGEDRHVDGGDKPVLVDSEWGKIGLAVCYDLRFPELFRTYALAGAKILFLPAEWPHPRLAHWRTLLRARAIENQMYVVACNRTGKDDKYHFFGHSTIIDPSGEIVVEAGEGEILLTATVDLDKVTAVRQHIPIFADRREDAYILNL